jgi:hypothetical protein
MAAERAGLLLRRHLLGVLPVVVALETAARVVQVMEGRERK